MTFDVRSVTYANDFHRINFVKLSLSNNVSEFDWIWQKYRLRFDETTKSIFFWKQFCDFLREQINLIKFRITIVEQKIKLLHQRNNQSIAQLIAYLEILEEQWLEFILNNLRANNMLFVLHEYFRKKIVRKNVNVASRKIVEEIVRQMKTMKTKSQFKTQNKFDYKQSKEQFVNNKRLKNDHQNEIQLMTIITIDSNQKKIRSTKNLFHIICYTCDKSRHYKSQCRSDDIDKQSRKNRNRST
jgi:GTPase involved in cell partitioning and DNA repair